MMLGISRGVGFIKLEGFYPGNHDEYILLIVPSRVLKKGIKEIVSYLYVALQRKDKIVSAGLYDVRNIGMGLCLDKKQREDWGQDGYFF